MKTFMYGSLVASALLFLHVVYRVATLPEATRRPVLFFPQDHNLRNDALDADDKQQDVWRHVSHMHSSLEERVDAALRHGWVEELHAGEIRELEGRFPHFGGAGGARGAQELRDSSVAALEILVRWVESLPWRMDVLLASDSLVGASRPLHEQPRNLATTHVMAKAEDLARLDVHLVKEGALGPRPHTHVLLILNGIEKHWTPFVFIDTRTGAHVKVHALRVSQSEPGSLVLRQKGVGRVVDSDIVFPAVECAFEGRKYKCPRDTPLFIHEVHGAEALSKEERYKLSMRD